MAKKSKEAMTVQEIEDVAKKYRFELFFCLSFILASLFTSSFFGTGWSIFLAALGGILGVWFPAKIEKFFAASFQFLFHQEKVTQIVLGVVGLILSVFLPPLIFLLLGLMGGKGIYSDVLKTEKTTLKEDLEKEK